MDLTVGMHPGASAPNPKRQLPQRKNIRAKFHDYSGGDYFVTICTQDKSHYFGEIRDSKILYTSIGHFADQALATLASHYSYVEVPLYVVMPNHIHAIICIRERKDAPGCTTCSNRTDAPGCAINSNGSDAPGCIPTIRTALGVVVGGYKQSVTRFARRNNIEFDWQKRYHDHIIRGSIDGNKITDYIQNNITRWADDCFNDCNLAKHI